MRTLLLLLCLDLYDTGNCLAQFPVFNSWSAGGYIRGQADIFSSFSSLAMLAEISDAHVAVAGHRRYALPELDMY